MIKPILLIIVSIALAVTALAIDHQQKPGAYDICWAAHNEISGESEQACAEALDREGSVFLCNKNGNICWTERV